MGVVLTQPPGTRENQNKYKENMNKETHNQSSINQYNQKTIHEKMKTIVKKELPLNFQPKTNSSTFYLIKKLNK